MPIGKNQAKKYYSKGFKKLLQNNPKIPEKFKQALIDNPQWILNDKEILEHLINSDKRNKNSNIVDLRDIYLKRLKCELEQLSKKHNYAISAAYENFLSASNLHRSIIKILEQKNLKKLLDVLSKEIKEILQSSTFLLLFSGSKRIKINNPNFINLEEEKIQEIINSSKITNSNLVTLRNNPDEFYINSFTKKNQQNLYCEALISLCTYLSLEKKAIIILGSSNKNTFNEKDKTDYLNILAKVISLKFEDLIVNHKSNE